MLFRSVSQSRYYGNALVTVAEDAFYYGLEYTEKAAITYNEDTNEVVIY